MNHRRFLTRGIGSLSVLAFLPFALACAHTRPKPELIFHRAEEPTAYKRYERCAERDFLHHFVRKAYSSAKRSDLDFAGPQQQTILDTWGRPDYIRKPFWSLEDEKVEEWVYLDHQHVYQFVNHQLVFEGPLTDLEQLLIRLGYPDQMITTLSESGVVKHFLYYGNVILPGRLESFNLANGWIVHNSQGSD